MAEAVSEAKVTKVRVGSLDEIRGKGCSVVHVEGHTLALFAVDGNIYAVDNRCPHMGFPLDRGSVHDGILTCHWHHARYQVALSVGAASDGVRFLIDPLPRRDVELATLKRWFRQFVEVRDSEGAERCVISAVQAGASDRDLADMLFSAATDHRYLT